MFGDQSQAGGVYSSALLVGGLCCEDDCLQDSDTVALVQSVKWINQNLDVCIAANPKVDVCNLDYGSNFFELGSEDNYDFVVFCNLYFSGLGNPEHSFFLYRAKVNWRLIAKIGKNLSNTFLLKLF